MRTRRRLIAGAAVVALVVAGVAVLGSAGEPADQRGEGPGTATARPAARSVPPEVVVQDDAELLHRSTARTRRTLEQIAALGADRVRITAGWSALAPEPDAPRAPRFDERDSRGYSREPLARLDRAVRLAHAAGLEIQIDLAFWAPRWAVARPLRDSTRQRWRPSVRRYARFVTAIVRRYSGRFDDPRRRGHRLPVVRQWTTWNEPNHAGFLLPQRERVDGRLRPAAPHHYRRMHEAGYTAIKAVAAGNEVLLGGLASRGSTRTGERHGMQPLDFLRELACVDERLQPITDERCRGFLPLRADGFAYHPYTLDTAPDGRSPQSDEAGMGELSRLSTLLAALHRRGRIARALPLYLTEYGYETDPPDRERGVGLLTQARYHGLATFLAWRAGVRMFPQFLVRDIGPDLRFPAGSAARWRDFQTGLLDHRGAAKPAVRAFRMPFWAYREGRETVLFGRVRPGGGGHVVRIEREVAPGRWEPVATRAPAAEPVEQFTTDGAGFYLRRLAWDRPTRLRARWLRSSGGSPGSVDVVVR